MTRMHVCLAVLLASQLGSALAAADPSAPDAREGGRRPQASLERALMEKAIAETLAQRSGRSVAEIRTMLGESPPPEVAMQLGLDRETTRAALEETRASVIRRVVEAGLLSAEQGRTLKAQPPPPMRGEGGCAGDAGDPQGRPFPPEAR